MLTTTATRACTPCTDCGEPCRVAYTAVGQRQVRLAADVTAGGLYALDEHGRAVRHSLVALYLAERDGQPLPGFDPHVCARPDHWSDR